MSGLLRRIKDFLRPATPWPVLYVYRKFRSLPEDIPHIFSFLFRKTPSVKFFKKLWIVFKCYHISYAVDCPHTEGEMIRVMSVILASPNSPGGVIVEAGSYKGGSTAKLSIAAHLADKNLFVFDSFEGLPENKEQHGKNIFGGDAYFPKGSYCGSLDEVKTNVSKYGNIENCKFVKGWFEDTLPLFTKPVDVAYMDVDLLSSTKTCLRYLYPLLIRSGRIFSQDGHLPLIIQLLDDNAFWTEIGFVKPRIKGLGRVKLVEIKKTPE